MLKVNSKNTKKRCEIWLKLTLKTPERRQWFRSGVFIINFEHNSDVCFSFLITYFEQVHVCFDSVVITLEYSIRFSKKC